MELNLEDTIEKYMITLDCIHKSISDLTATYDKTSKANSEYLMIPVTEKGKKYIRFNVTNLKNHESSVLFMSPQTIGFKQYDSKHNIQYDYSISQKDDTKIVQINYADGTGLKRIYKRNPDTNVFNLAETKETVKACNVIDLSTFNDPIINDDLLLHYSFVNQENEPLVCFFISYGKKDGNLYPLDEHPELSEISHTMKLSHTQLIDNFLDTLHVMEPHQLYCDFAKFKKTFRGFLNSKQNTVSDDPNITNTDPDTEDR